MRHDADVTQPSTLRRADERELAALTRRPGVAYVAADATVQAAGRQSPATWGLDRLDQRDAAVGQRLGRNATGAGVTAYVIDTGVRTTHVQFEGRAVSGFDAVDGGPADDCNGHGTHVAGTIGGSTYGVAKQVRLVAVRALDCAGNGMVSGVIAAIDRVTQNHQAGDPAVANMSIGGPPSMPLDTAVGNSIDDARDLRRRRRQRRRGRVRALAVTCTRRDRRGRDDVGRRPAGVVELRRVRRRVRARRGDHLGVEHVRHGDEHGQRHFDGVAARRRRGCARICRRRRTRPGDERAADPR